MQRYRCTAELLAKSARVEVLTIHRVFFRFVFLVYVHSRVEESAFNLYDTVMKYYVARAKLCAKLLKYPNTLDYQMAVVELDRKVSEEDKTKLHRLQTIRVHFHVESLRRFMSCHVFIFTFVDRQVERHQFPPLASRTYVHTSTQTCLQASPEGTRHLRSVAPHGWSLQASHASATVAGGWSEWT